MFDAPRPSLKLLAGAALLTLLTAACAPSQPPGSMAPANLTSPAESVQPQPVDEETRAAEVAPDEEALDEVSPAEAPTPGMAPEEKNAAEEAKPSTSDSRRSRTDDDALQIGGVKGGGSSSDNAKDSAPSPKPRSSTPGKSQPKSPAQKEEKSCPPDQPNCDNDAEFIRRQIGR